MTGYEIVFDDDAGVPKPGETLDIGGALWDVARIEQIDGKARVHLVAHPPGEVAAHARPAPAPVTLAPPTSFESELVYTLNDLSSRLNTLAGALNAYWGKGAA
ncbi:MAG TPA: hypothetical protein VGK79_08480 [Gaiellaceae bacterium]